VSKSKGKKEKDFKGKKSKQYSLDNLVDIECYNYNNKGHFKMICSQKKRNGKCKKFHLKKESVDVLVASNSYKFARVLVASVSDTYDT